MRQRSMGWRFPVLVLALGLHAVLASRVGAEAATPGPLPAGVTECKFDALANVPGDPGLVVRAAPRDDTPVVAQPAVIARFRVVGFREGWFLIEDAVSREPDGATLYAGQGWVDGTCTNQLTTCDFDQGRPWPPDAPLPPGKSGSAERALNLRSLSN